MSATTLILRLQRACDDVVRGFKEGEGTPSDLEDARAVLLDANRVLANLAPIVRKQHDTNRDSE